MWVEPMIQKNQYALSSLFALLTFTSLIMAYIQAAGLWGFFLAVIPPLCIGGCLINVFRPDVIQDDQDPNRMIPHPARFDPGRTLSCLIVGFLIWIPILFLILYSQVLE